MALVLTIENERSLPNGAPVSVRLTGKRGIDIGRSATIDWSLPDPTRFISSRHCEVRYRDDGYWLNDLSTNGTFLNDSAQTHPGPVPAARRGSARDRKLCHRRGDRSR